MKNRLTSIIIVLCVACSLALPVGATNSSSSKELEYQASNTEITPIAEDEMVIKDASFLSNATISKKSLGNDVYSIELRNPEYSSIDPGTGKRISTAATLIAFSKEELTAIEQKVEAATSNLIQKPKDNNWGDFGGSLYLESTLFYDITYVSGQARYKIELVRVKYLVRNGTSCTNRSVTFVCNMALHNASNVTTQISPNAGNPCSVDAPYYWPYVSHEGLRYGAFFYCTVQRPSGETKQCSLYHDLFN